ncbi:MAG: hypothetical protein K1X88_26870 [Nannocystaceae bacterium]|nr:hypothetical protein [Nannocystaceae bacterium]
MVMAHRCLASLTLAALAAAAVVPACASHEWKPVFRRAIVFDDRGISLPLPPPSLTADPEQEVDVHGVAQGDDPLPADARVRMLDVDGTADVEVELDAEGGFTAAAVPLDLRANCLEVWIDSEGGESEHVFVHAEITGETTITTVLGCD